MEITTLSKQATQEDEGQIVHVRDAAGELQYYTPAIQGAPDGKTERSPVTIRVAGSYSKLYRRTADAQRDRLFKQRRLTLTGDQIEQQQLELTAVCVLGWEGFTANGAPFPCSPENAISLFTAAPWIREQVEEAMNDHAGFSKPASSI